MKKHVLVGPPDHFQTYSPSMLFRYFLSVGGWTYAGFADDLSLFQRRGMVSTETIADWARNDTVTQKYRLPLFALFLDRCDVVTARAWHDAFVTVWATHEAARFQQRRSAA